MANPLLIPSPLNRVRASVGIELNNTLDVSASYLGTEGISVTFNGNVTTQLNGLVSTVNSEEPYVPAQVRISMLKSLALSNSWMEQVQKSPTLGQVTIKSDTAEFKDLIFYNCAIMSVGDVAMNGTQAEFVITINGFWPVGGDLFNPV